MQQRNLRPAYVVGAIAALLRVIWVLLASRQPIGLSDPLIYLRSAASIAAGDGYTSLLGQPTAYYPPGYPFFLGGVQWVVESIGLGDHLVLVAGLIQALLGGVAAAAIVVAGEQLLARDADPGRRWSVGVIAGVLFACWPNLILHAPLILSESLFLALFAVLLAALVTWTSRTTSAALTAHTAHTAHTAPAGHAAASPQQVDADVSGSTAGAGSSWKLSTIIVLSTIGCTWVRPQSVLLLVPAALVAWLLGRVGWSRTLQGAGLLVIGMVVAVVPWTIRNAVVMDGFVPMSTNTGDNLCIGFHTGATGSFTIIDACATEGRYVDGPGIEVARDAELRKRALRWIVDHPGEITDLTLEKLVATFGYDNDGLAAWEGYDGDRHLEDAQRDLIYLVSNVYYWCVGAFALAGLVLTVRDWWAARRVDRSGAAGMSAPVRNGLLVTAITLSGVVMPVLFFGDPRFKVPIVPCLALLAASAVHRLLEARSEASDRPTGDADPDESSGTSDPTVTTTTGTA